jgi:glycyl-tRNA synthetase beta chain
MAELFIELFSEEIPSNLQIDARNKIKNSIDQKLKKKEIKFSLIKSFSTPQRLVFIVEGLPEKITEKKKLISNQVNLIQLLKDLFFL